LSHALADHLSTGNDVNASLLMAMLANNLLDSIMDE